MIIPCESTAPASPAASANGTVSPSDIYVSDHKEARCQQRREGERDDQRHERRARDREAELAEEAADLKQAGVTAYNHNVDTSPEHYPNIVSTHTFEDRLRTIRHAQDAGMSVCCGGILGLGETIDDRLKMLEVISNFNPQPESIPINALMPIKGTPMQDVPASYLHWLWTQNGWGKGESHRGNPVADYTFQNLHALKKENPDLIWT